MPPGLRTSICASLRAVEHVEVARIRHHELVAHIAGAAREQPPLLGFEHLRIAIP